MVLVDSSHTVVMLVVFHTSTMAAISFIRGWRVGMPGGMRGRALKGIVPNSARAHVANSIALTPQPKTLTLSNPYAAPQDPVNFAGPKFHGC